MTREEHKEIMTKLLATVSADHQATATQLMTELSEDYEKTLTDFETATKNNESLTEKNEKLREVNADLFLKVGVSKAPATTTENRTTTDNGNENLPTFDSLFNEKGELI